MSLNYNPDTKIKFFLRADAEVETITQDGWYWKSGHWAQSRPHSLIAQLVDEEMIPQLTSGDGRWYFPGLAP